MKSVTAILILGIMACTIPARSQKQLVLLKGEQVMLRLEPGDAFVYRLKGSKTVKTTYVNNLSDSAVVTHNDTVSFRTIDRVYFRQRKFYNTAGTFLVVFGGGLFLIDQANEVIVQGNSPSLDDRVSAISLSTLAVGLPMMLVRKNSQRLDRRHHLLTVENGSAFFRRSPD